MGRFRVRVEAHFEAAHNLRSYGGSPEPLHGHSYKVEATLVADGNGVDHEAIAVDFVAARRDLEVLAKRLDYTYINDVPPFDELNPSAENIAVWFTEELQKSVASRGAIVSEVTVWEGPFNAATYTPGS